MDDDELKCMCGLTRVPAGTHRVLVCINCDTVQKSEYNAGKRVKTVEDARYMLSLTKKMQEWYPPKVEEKNP